MRATKRYIRVQVLINILQKPQGASYDHPAETVTDETDFGAGGKVQVLEVSSKLYGEALAHGLDIVVGAALVGAADEDFGFEVDL